jgi:soluble P-type ATPase
MIELNIPGRGTIELEHLVCDVNGTLAVDGNLGEGLSRLLNSLGDRLTIHLLTADTHRRQGQIDQQMGMRATRLQAGNEAQQKAAYVENLGAAKVVAIGQGANDAAMLNAPPSASASFPASSAVEALNADIFVPDIYTALELLEKPCASSPRCGNECTHHRTHSRRP